MRRQIGLILIMLSYGVLKGQNLKVDTVEMYHAIDSLYDEAIQDAATLNQYLAYLPIIVKIDKARSESLCNKTLQLAKKLNQSDEIILAHLYSAYSDIESTVYKSALGHLHEAKRLLDETDDDIRKAQLELYQGLFFLNQTAYKEAISRFLASMDHLKNYPENRMMGANLNNIGVCMLEQDLNDSAIYYFDKALAVPAYMADETDKALVLTNIGSTRLELGAYDLAIQHLSSANEILTRNSGNRILSLNEVLIARTYRQLGKYEFVPQHLDAAIHHSQLIRSPKKMYLAYQAYKDYYLDINQPDSAVVYLQKLMVLQDSVLNISKYDEIQQAIGRFESQVHEKELILKEQSIELLKNKSLNNQLIILVLAVTIILVMMILVYIKNKVEKDKLLIEKEKKLQKAELEVLKRDLDHKKRKMVTVTLEIMKKNDFLRSHKNALQALEKEVSQDDRIKLFKLRRSLDDKLEMKKDWNEFSLIFEQVHHGFFAKLKETCPSLSPAELRLAALLKLNISSHRISEILGISSESVRTARSRLRKKLGLSREDNLVNYIIDIY